MRRSFEDRVVWITGGGSGIGRALALEMAARGAVVVVSGRREGPLSEVVDAIRGLGGRAQAVVCDVTDEGSVASAVEAIVRGHGGLDVAVANAGFSVAGRIERLSAEDWRRQFETNVVGLAVTARHALPALRERRGRLVLVGSVAGLVCAPGVGAYHASKHAVRAIGQTLAMETHGSGVTVTTIHPGFVESDIARTDNEGHFDAARPDPRPALLMWKAERAARVMADAIHARRREYVFTGHGRFAAWMGRHAPDVVHLLLTRIGVEYRRSTSA
jgi:NAD(P)-dependent dehydrogenase (short-subunit alcohol dehydrogenase family)